LDLALRFLDLASQHPAFDDLALLHSSHLQETLGALRIAEDPHQIVFHRQVETAGAWVALATGPATQLVVDTTRLMAFSTDDVQPAGCEHLVVPRLPLGPDVFASRIVYRPERADLRFEITPEDDVGTAAGHVGRNRHGTRPAGLRDDVRLALM